MRRSHRRLSRRSSLATRGARTVSVFPINERELACVAGVQPPVHYHSLIAEKGPCIDRYREFVIFHASDYVCPEYLIAYHRV